MSVPVSEHPLRSHPEPVPSRVDVGSGTLGIRLRNVSLTYPGGVRALNGISFTVAPGEHVAVLGPSGSGKSSLLRCLSGWIAPDEGSVEVAGRVAVIHQDLRLVKQRTALQNVMDGALARTPLWRTLLRLPKHTDRDQARKLLERVGLAERIHHRVSRLSGGEQQRVAIARALMHEPAVLLADEPVASLDCDNAHQIMQLISDLAQEHGLTVISVLHDPELAHAYAGRSIGLEQGALASPRAVSFNRTANADERSSSADVEHDRQSKRTTSDFSPQRITTVHPNRPEHVSGAAPIEPDRPAWFAPLKLAGIAAAAVAVYAWAVTGLEIGQRQVQDAMPRVTAFVWSMLPASWSEVMELPWSSLLASLVETLQMSLIGTTAGVLLSIPLAAMAAENIGPVWMRVPMRFVLNIVRTVPSLIWALLFVAAVGAGSLAGVLALFCYSVGYLTKFFYEGFEGVDPGAPNALKELGAGGGQRFLNAVWPAARPAFLSSSLFMLEYNVRAASVLGIVGAGGIGFYLMMFVEYRNFPAVLACLLILLVVVQVMDTVSKRLRAWLVKG